VKDAGPGHGSDEDADEELHVRRCNARPSTTPILARRVIWAEHYTMVGLGPASSPGLGYLGDSRWTKLSPRNASWTRDSDAADAVDYTHGPLLNAHG
jgi:hypothetical protein